MDTTNIYRTLQKHLDRQPVGFPAVSSGADIALLKALFDESDAKLALQLSYRPATTEEIARKSGLTPAEVKTSLEKMFIQGAIAHRSQNGQDCWYLVPLVVGMYEFKDGRPTVDFLRLANDYMQTPAYGLSLLAAKPSQMRTIPINRSIPLDHHVAPYEQIREIVQRAPAPFVVLRCICRESARLRRQRCTKTKRRETCLAIGHTAQGVLRRGHGRELARAEALELLMQNENEGLVFQPSGAQTPEFICSCCGCCCGMLGLHKQVPRPVDFWTSAFRAELNRELCTGCGRCVERCQVDAARLDSSAGSYLTSASPSNVSRTKAHILAARCIGCGLCIPTCPTKALRLVAKTSAAVPPIDETALLEEIRRNKQGVISRWLLKLRIACNRSH